MRSGRRRQPGSAMLLPSSVPAAGLSPRHGRPHWPPVRARLGPRPRPGPRAIPPDRRKPGSRPAGRAARRSRRPDQEPAGRRRQLAHPHDGHRPFASQRPVYVERIKAGGINGCSSARDADAIFASQRRGAGRNRDRSRTQPIIRAAQSTPPRTAPSTVTSLPAARAGKQAFHSRRGQEGTCCWSEPTPPSGVSSPSPVSTRCSLVSRPWRKRSRRSPPSLAGYRATAYQGHEAGSAAITASATRRTTRGTFGRPIVCRARGEG